MYESQVERSQAKKLCSFRVSQEDVALSTRPVCRRLDVTILGNLACDFAFFLRFSVVFAIDASRIEFFTTFTITK